MKNTNNCNSCECSCIFYEHCDERNKTDLNEHREIIHFKKREAIFRTGFVVDGFYVLKEGYVKVLRTGGKMRKQIFRLCKPGDIIGHRAINQKYFPIDAMAMTDATLCFFPMEYFYEFLKQNSSVTYNLLMFMADELFISEKNARDCSLMNVRERVANSLLYINKVYGNDKKAPSLSRVEIAELATTTKEQVSKYLREFQKEGIIDLKDKQIIIIDKPKLDKIVEKYSDRYL